MPRFSVPIIDPATGKQIGVACGSRPRRPRCGICASPDAELECDGCDKALCRACSVAPRAGVDYCLKCFEPAWKHWLQIRPSSLGAENRIQRRQAFRAWARLNPGKFLELAPPLSEASKRLHAAQGKVVGP